MGILGVELVRTPATVQHQERDVGRSKMPEAKMKTLQDGEQTRAVSQRHRLARRCPGDPH